jgi:hypothetical protein
MNVMASVSEDCTVKLWDLNLLVKNEEDGFAKGADFSLEPYFTF